MTSLIPRHGPLVSHAINSQEIPLLGHFHKNDLISVINYLTSLTFGSLFHVILSNFAQKLVLVLSS